MAIWVNGERTVGMNGTEISPVWINFLTTDPTSVGQGTWVRTIGATFPYCAYFRNSSNADADNFSVLMRAPAGTYTVRLHAGKDNDFGILDIDMDGAEIHSVDLYAAVADKDNMSQVTGVAITGGNHVFRFRVDGQNVASGGHKVRLTAFYLVRTA